MTVFCGFQLCVGTIRFIWLVSIWFPYIAKRRLEKIFLHIFPGNRIKELSRFSILIYLFLLAVEGTSKRMGVCRREGASGAPLARPGPSPPQRCRGVNFGFRAFVFLSRCESFLFLNPVTSPVLPFLFPSSPRSSSFGTAVPVVPDPRLGSCSAVTRASKPLRASYLIFGFLGSYPSLSSRSQHPRCLLLHRKLILSVSSLKTRQTFLKLRVCPGVCQINNSTWSWVCARACVCRFAISF